MQNQESFDPHLMFPRFALKKKQLMPSQGECNLYIHLKHA